MKILPFATMWIDLEGIMLSETNQRERQIFCNSLCVESKNKTNEYNSTKTDSQITENKPVVTNGEREGSKAVEDLMV